jgi:putative Mg2+ transporter-C (MgtC) family protein
MAIAGLLIDWMPDSLEALFARLIDVIVCLGTAVICGYIVGRERTASKAPVGVRTHVLVCLGAASFVHLGVVAAYVNGTEVDFARLIQSIATGIGFLGAGAIFKAEATVRGVNTATSIWLMGAAGTAAGCGAIAFALIISLIAFAVLRWSGEPVALDEVLEEVHDLVFEDMPETLLARRQPRPNTPTAPPPATPPPSGPNRPPQDDS